ncbi:MAG TPA: ABC transporter permease, partial [Vicinamibacteria bacterium]
DGPVDEVEVGWTTPGFLESLGVRPHIGRLPTREELTSEKPDAMVLSYGFWRDRYGSDPGILGRAIDFDDERWTVVGVMPPDFRMLFPPEEGVPERLAAWVPWGSNAYREMSRSFRVFTTVGRLRSGYSMEQAAQELDSVADRVRAEAVEYQGSGFGFRLVPLAGSVAAHVRPALLVLSGVVVFVLLIAAANVANLLLARASDGERELSVRAALGASRSQLLRALLAESVLLGALGCAAGLLLAGWGLEFVHALDPGRLPRIQEAGLDVRTVGAAGVAAFLAALVTGLLVALRAVGTVGSSSLHVGVRTAGAAPPRLRRSLVVSQLALSLMLLVGAGLLVQSIVRLTAVDPGFEPRGLLTLRLSLPDVRYSYRDQGPRIAAFYRRLDEAIAQLPGVEEVGSTLNPPLSGLPVVQRPYAWKTATGETEWGSALASYTTVTPGWFRSARIRLLAGRFLDAHDQRDRAVAVVVDSGLARRAWPGGDAVGQEIRVQLFQDGMFRPIWGEVVGVVETVRLARLEAADGEQVYVAHGQAPQRTMHLTVRTRQDPRALVPAVQAEVHALEKDLPVFDVHLAVDHVRRAAAVP